MRYRRLLSQLRRQDWLAVAIDLVIVVVGVFTCFAVEKFVFAPHRDVRHAKTDH